MEKLRIQPIKKNKTTKEIVYEKLKTAILIGSINNQEILTETMLSEALETSRTPIREAVADLTKEGLLVHIPRKGFHVREITENEKDQIIFLRSAIESEGLKKLASTVTKEQIVELLEIVGNQETSMKEDDRVRYIELDQLFHQQILEFANQNILSQLLQDMYNLTRLIGHHALMKDGRMREVLKEHKEIIQSLEINDGDKAAQLMKEHLEITKEIVKTVKTN
ncbi:GntR family transcriptional regulator [Virgibacillus necropolis]|uniref:GntR family transcriptional regulator n=1 Tax=Virgibacillus necropolis TaxID=163877 RepID=UPI001D04F359|nr:GntR family transcriptional regulator [Virgibacillus necropolis]